MMVLIISYLTCILKMNNFSHVSSFQTSPLLFPSRLPLEMDMCLLYSLNSTRFLSTTITIDLCFSSFFHHFFYVAKYLMMVAELIIGMLLGEEPQKKVMARIKPQALLLQSKKKKAPTRVSLTTIITCNLLVILVVLSLYATYNHWYKRSSNQLGMDLKNYEHSKNNGEQKKFDLPGYAVMETSKGSITVELHKDSSPEVVDRFLDLCQKGYFKGMHFHRVIKHFVIQGGDPHNLGAAEGWNLHRKSNGQLETSPKHEAFMLGTSKAKTNANGFEIFITTAPIPELNDKLNVFGRVIKGENVVQEIEEVDTDEQYQPKSIIEIINITLKQEP